MIHLLGTELVHFYLLEEDGELTLIDAGCRGYRPMLEAALCDLDRTLDDVRAIVLTHADPDHVGFAGELQRGSRDPRLRASRRQPTRATERASRPRDPA